jgi:hypothetical protein
MEFFGTEASLVIDSTGWKLGDDPSEPPHALDGLWDVRPHVRNFLDCMKARKAPNADLMQTRCSAAFLHVGNIAWRMGSETKEAVELVFDQERGTLDSPRATPLLGRPYRAPWRLG